MSFQVAFTLEGDKELIQALRNISGHKVDRAVYIGMGKLKTKTKTEMKRAFTRRYNVASGVIAKKISKPRLARENGAPVLQVFGSAQPMSSRLFRPTMGVRHQNRKNARFRIFKGGSYESHPRGFRVYSNKKGGLQFGGKAFKRNASGRNFRGLGGPSFHNAFTGGKFAKQMTAEVNRATMPTLTRETKAAIRALGKGYIR